LGDPRSLCYGTVLVDDEYAFRHPTHIITSGAQQAASSPAPSTASSPLHRVYHGWSKLNKQLDRLISLTGNGGGSEIKVARVSGYLQVKDQQVTSFSGDLVTLNYTRADIRKHRWKRVFSIWHPDWKADDKEEVYAVYEDDTQGTREVKGSLSTTINLPGDPSRGKTVGEIGFNITVHTQDEIITQRKFDRDSYFKDALNNQGWTYVTDPNDFLPNGQDWPVMDGGTIWNFSMPYRVF